MTRLIGIADACSGTCPPVRGWLLNGARLAGNLAARIARRSPFLLAFLWEHARSVRAASPRAECVRRCTLLSAPPSLVGPQPDSFSARAWTACGRLAKPEAVADRGESPERGGRGGRSPALYVLCSCPCPERAARFLRGPGQGKVLREGGCGVKPRRATGRERQPWGCCVVVKARARV